MANTCKVTESTISVKFELADVSLTTYIKISQFIESLGVSMNSANEESVVSTVFPLAQDGPKVSVPQKSEVKPEKKLEQNNKYAKVGRYSGWETVVEIFKDADANPDKYVFVWQTAKAWMMKFDELKDEGVFQIAHVLGSMATNALVKRSEQYNKAAGKVEVLFYCPIRRTAGNEIVAPQKLTDGEILRNVRLAHSFTYEDIHILTGYETDTIAKWESGKYAMSSEAKKEIIKAFGEDIFAKAKKEVA